MSDSAQDAGGTGDRPRQLVAFIIASLFFRKHLSYKLWDHIEDLVHQTLLDALSGAAMTDSVRNLKAYVLGIARHKLQRFIQETPRFVTLDDDDDIPFSAHVAQVLVAARLIDRERRKIVREELGHLSSIERRVLELRYDDEGVSNAEAARQLGNPAGRVQPSQVPSAREARTMDRQARGTGCTSMNDDLFPAEHLEAPAGCTSPELGRKLDPYLAGKLSASDEQAFEDHYFECAACLEGLRLRQAVKGALAEARSSDPVPTRVTAAASPRRKVVWALAGSLALAATVGGARSSSAPCFGSGPRSRSRRCRPTARPTRRFRERPPGLRSGLTLVLPAAAYAVYDVRILDASGQLEFEARLLHSSSPSESPLLMFPQVG